MVTTEFATYEVDENGIALSRFDYELPLAEEETVFTWFGVLTAEIYSYFSDPNELLTHKYINELTNVRFE